MEHQSGLARGIEAIKGKLFQMGALAGTMIDAAITTVTQRDADPAGRMPEYEEECDRSQLEIDEMALGLMATQQPVAKDLRFLVGALKINGELERIGDLAVNISESAGHLLARPPLRQAAVIPQMGRIAREMVRQAIRAFVTGDVLAAQEVISTDDQVDQLKRQTLAELLAHMNAAPDAAEASLSLLLITRSIERIADHATYVAQDVIYMIQGRDVRHPGLRQ